MSNMKEAMKSQTNTEFEAAMIKQKMEKLFLQDREGENRYGLHASAIIAGEGEFCYRAQLLSLFFRQNQGEQLPIKSLKIFAQGNAMHEKWYRLFQKAGIDVAIERTLFIPEYDLSFTIDALLDLNGKEYICDIKSQNSFAFKKAKGHPSGEKQINFYMWALSKYTGKKYTKGFVLVDSKDDSEIRIVPVHYDKEKNVEYIQRLKDVQEMKKEFLEDRTVPKRKCKSCDCKHAMSCSMRDACWNIGIGRIPLTKEERKGPGERQTGHETRVKGKN